MSIRFIYGTSNKEKINQVRSFFATQDIDIDIISLEDIGFNEEIDENGETLEENSKIKAEAVKKYCKEHNIKEIIMTDDTGLEVDALDGRPGVHSARYAGDHAPQEVSIKKLLEEMKDVPEEKRTARFVCIITVVMPTGEMFATRGEVKGKIAMKPRYNGKIDIWPCIYCRWF